MEDYEPLPTDPLERRKVQNRNAQRKFRNRRHQHQVSQALQHHGTAPPVQPLSWPLLYDSGVLAAANLPPSQQPHVSAPQCDLSTFSQQPQASSHSAYGSGMIPLGQGTTNQANDSVFSNSASDSEFTAMSYLSNLDSDSPMFDRDVAPAFTIPAPNFPMPSHDSSNPSTAISTADSRSTRPTTSDSNTIRAYCSTSLPLHKSNTQGDLNANSYFQHQALISAPNLSSESQGDSPSSESHSSNSSNDSSDNPSPAKSDPTYCEVIKYNDTMSVLHIASDRGHSAIVSILLAQNLDPNEPDGSGRPPLHLAAINGHASVTSLLLSSGTHINAIDAVGRTALHWAVLRGHEGVVKVFLDAGGADLNLQDQNGWSVLHVAVERGSEANMRLLLRHGADLKLKARKCEVWKREEREMEHESSRERVAVEG